MSDNKNKNLDNLLSFLFKVATLFVRFFLYFPCKKERSMNAIKVVVSKVTLLSRYFHDGFMNELWRLQTTTKALTIIATSK